MTREEIADILKTLRKNACMTQKEVAQQLGRTQQIIGHWETGYSQPDADTLFKLCELYKTSVDEAFGFNPVLAEKVTRKELEFIKQYRRLNSQGKEAVNNILDYVINNLPVDDNNEVDKPTE